MSGSTYAAQIAQAASQYGVPDDLLYDQIAAESNFNPNAVNPSSGATGIAQILPTTAANPGYGIASVDPNDPAASINFAAQYDAALYNQTGSWTSALESYGTLPSSGGSMNTAQTNLFNAAQQADGGQSAVDDIFADPGNDLFSGVANTLGTNDGTTYSTSATGGTTSGTTTGAAGTSNTSSTGGCSWTSPGCWFSSFGSWAGNYLTAAGFVVVAIILIIGAVYLFGRSVVNEAT